MGVGRAIGLARVFVAVASLPKTDDRVEDATEAAEENELSRGMASA